jgi:hypothetical protein
MKYVLLVLGIFSACLFQQAYANIDSVDPNVAARYFGGLPTPGLPGSVEGPASDRWIAYSSEFERHWKDFREQRLVAAQDFSRRNLRSEHRVVYYMFSGPDFPYVDAFFPDASVYVLSGLEPVADPSRLADIIHSGNVLVRLHASLNGYFKRGFFKTEDMSQDSGFAGVTPLLMALVARSGGRLAAISAFHLGEDGQLNFETADKSDGLKIDFVDSRDKTKLLYYFAVNLVDGSNRSEAFLRFCAKTGDGDALLKSASYLLHEDNFSRLRSFLLDHALLLLEDDSGIPLRYLRDERWKLVLFGKYLAPIGRFEKYFQPELASMAHGINGAAAAVPALFVRNGLSGADRRLALSARQTSRWSMKV